VRALTAAAAALFLAVSFGAAEDSAPDVKQVVRGVEARYNRARTLETEFFQRYTLGPTTLVESGRVYFQKPGRMRWDYERPEPKLFLADGQYAYLYVPAEKQVRRQSLKQAPEYQAAFALLFGRVNFGRLFGQIGLVDVHRPEEPTRWQLRGRARSDQQSFTEIWFDVNERFQVLRVELRQRDGSLLEFHFLGWRENHPLDPELFRLSVPPGTAWLEDAPQ